MNPSAFASECTRCREADAGRAGRDEDTQSADREIHVEPFLVAERIAQSQTAAALKSTTIAAWTAMALWDYNCIAFRRAAPNGQCPHEPWPAFSSSRGGFMDRSPTSRRRRTLLKGAGAAAALGVAGFPAIVRAQSEAIRIGHLTPRTGFLGPLGEYAVMGVNLAVDEINAAGGIMGRKIDL